MTAVLAVPDTTSVNPREKTARRLLGSSSKNSHSPALAIDWDAPDGVRARPALSPPSSSQ
jgi:hypothetical protein